MSDPGLLERYHLFIFDADDTLRRTTVPGKPCPHAPGEWVLMPGVRETLARVQWNRIDAPRFGLASNQDQVAYGHVSLEMARCLLRDLALAAFGIVPPDAALQLCPHPPGAACPCRKPDPGMLHAIMTHYGVGPAYTLFVGNNEVDREAALRAGTAFDWADSFFTSNSRRVERSRAPHAYL